MSSPSDIYNTLFAGNKVSIKLDTKMQYNSLRVALCRLHQTPKMILEVTDDSLCASYDATQGIGTFWIGPPRKNLSKTDFQIVAVEELPNA